MELKLNIYEGREIKKTYTANEYDIMFGTVEDLIQLIDIDNLKGGVNDTDFIGAVAQLLKGGFNEIKTILIELFPDVTEDELRNTKMKEVIQLIVDLVRYGFSEMMLGAKNSKN